MILGTFTLGAVIVRAAVAHEVEFNEDIFAGSRGHQQGDKKTRMRIMGTSGTRSLRVPSGIVASRLRP
ncbi:MAG: hypothetical protein GY888_29960 [Planctomycetaceae bacterium]|nr:hypothetical protein [Planctomycetaceae bacterium]